MSLIDVSVDLRRVLEQVTRIADALERLSPVPVYREVVAEAEFSEPSESEQYAADLREEQARGRT